MAILDLRKVTLIGRLDHKNAVLKTLQGQGIMHVIPLSESERKLRSRPHDYYEALKYLMDCPEQRHPLRHEEDFSASDVVELALRNKQQTRHINNQVDKKRKEIEELRPWGNFSTPAPEELNGRQIFFYKVPGYKRDKIKLLKDCTVQEIYSGNRFAYIVVIAKQEPPANAIPGQKVRLPQEPLNVLERQVDALIMELEDLEDERERLTRWVDLLVQHLHRIEDQTMFDYTADRTLDEDGFFALQGWVPSKDLDEIGTLSNEYGLAHYIEQPTRKDNPPTLFENPESTAAGESLVKFYQTPGYFAWDPSTILYFAFAIFFAMIMSDAGYAVLLMGIMLLFWRKLGGSTEGKRMRRLGILLSVTAFIYGMLVGSYFGVTPENPILQKIHVLDVNNFDMMMKVSIFVGVLHLIMANLVMAWKSRKDLVALGNIGWVAIFVGATGLWITSPENFIFQAITAIGGAGVLFFTSARPVNSFKNVIMRFLDGLMGLTNISKAFGDTLSYMRLFALGLASASLAIMFNELAGQVADGLPGIGTFLAILVLIFGHSLNFVLGIMGGVVHGLRLNLIEFFSWSLHDEGYEFKPFQLKEKELWNKNS